MSHNCDNVSQLSGKLNTEQGIETAMGVARQGETGAVDVSVGGSDLAAKPS